MLRASLYFHTIRHLRPRQIFAKLRYGLISPGVPDRRAPDVASADGEWIGPPKKPQSLLGPSRAKFLNRERELKLPADWQAGAERLWLYNLHYFDDLVASGAEMRRSWHEALIAAWIRDNPPALGVGWDPYPISLRAVNWIKWFLAGNKPDGPALSSLATQLRCLRQRIEWHLLANHLFANAKALMFGGLFFVGDEADEWLEFGARLVSEQLAEQILPDGGHFERSPMYHALILEDVLDLTNAMRTYSARPFAAKECLSSSTPDTAARMLAWLDTMTHPDGEIALFNDAALGVALPPSSLREYATVLGVELRARRHDLASSGYIRLDEGRWCVIFDAAPVGPDFQPGHAHADTLSFELSVDDERLITNSGTSTYEQGPQRAVERATKAHNTVEIDGQDSSEVWAAFRVARRAQPLDRIVELSGNRAFASCAHDGYARLRGRPVHRRALEVTAQAVRWNDRVEGAGSHKAIGFIPLQPGVRVAVDGTRATLLTPGGRRVVLSGTGIPRFTIQEGSYARGFGVRVPRPVVTWEVAGGLPLATTFNLSLER